MHVIWALAAYLSIVTCQDNTNPIRVNIEKPKDTTAKGPKTPTGGALTPEEQKSIQSIISGSLIIGRHDLKRGKRPKAIDITPMCKREYDFRHYEFPRMTPVLEFGYGGAPRQMQQMQGTATNITLNMQETLVRTQDDIDAVIRAGQLFKANVSLLEQPDVQLLDRCNSMSMPQLIYLIMSKKLQYLDDSCISSIQPALFNALTPGLAEAFFQLKPGYVTLIWRYFRPAVKAALPSVDQVVLRARSRSFLCCSLNAADFCHYDRLASASRDCLWNLFPPLKCAQIPPSFWKPGGFELNKASVPAIELARLNAIVPIDKLPELPQSANAAASMVDQKLLLAHVLDHVSLDCYDAMSPESRIALWAQLQVFGISSGEIVHGRRRQIAEDMHQHVDLAKKYGATVPHTDSSSSPPIATASIWLALISLLVLLP